MPRSVIHVSCFQCGICFSWKRVETHLVYSEDSVQTRPLEVNGSQSDSQVVVHLFCHVVTVGVPSTCILGHFRGYSPQRITGLSFLHISFTFYNKLKIEYCNIRGLISTLKQSTNTFRDQDLTY